jgi:hypothetical protein
MNIFARVLAYVLAAHGKELGSLYTMKSEWLSIPPSKVTRLKRSLTQDHTATLNAEELEMLRQQVPLTDEDMRRLRAALVAEAVRYMLAGRIVYTQATEIATLLFDLLILPDTGQLKRVQDDVFETVRGVMPGLGDPLAEIETPSEPSSTADDEGPVSLALEPARRAYEDGALWLEYARHATARGVRVSSCILARSLLARAREMTQDAPTVAMNTPEQAELLALIEGALGEANVIE